MRANEAADSLGSVFVGRRGRLLAGLLLAEFAAAVQTIAYSAVLPLASSELSGASLYGATVAAGSLTTLLVLASGPGIIGRLGPRRALVIATSLYVGGVLLAALAPAMGLVLAGSVLRGLASGVLLGVGLTAIGGLYEDSLRRRVLGLFALMWLLPSFAGPVVNSLVAAAFGWRWAMAWPAVLVLVARMLVVRDAGLIPWRPERERLEIGTGLWLVAGLVLASVASGLGYSWSAGLFGVGVLIGLVASWRVVNHLTAGVGVKVRARVIPFFGLCLAFFGGQGLVSLAIIEGQGRGVVAASVALGAGLVAWSLVGLRPGRTDAWLGDTATLGLLWLAAALVALAAATPSGASAGFVVAVGAFAVAGIGMGMAYPRLSAEAFDELPSDNVSRVATAVGFAEVAGTAVGSLLGGGVYSLAGSVDAGASISISTAFVLLALAAGAAGLACARRGRPLVA
ncbi:MAG: MFS transporter [Actinomycetota bacterium]|nr:MFS transporter [Actinomycetota bacterium]